MKIQILFTTGFVLLGLTACQHHPTTASLSKNIKILETIENIDAFPSSEGNRAQLIKQTDDCLIQFTGFYETGQATERWIFKAKTLTSAHSTLIKYDNGGLTNPQNLGQPLKVASTEQKNFDIRNPDIQSNFNALLQNFNASNLAQCK